MSSDAPPSYDSVVANLKQRIASNPHPQHVLDISSQLSQTEIDILGANVDNHPPMTAQEQADFKAGMAKALSSDEALQHIEAGAAEASEACSNIENLFSELVTKMAELDSKNSPPKQGPFTPRLRVIHDV
jgi:hypothetical protein